ncbi:MULTISPECIES: DUF4286 family protein [unclassified Paraburkholderia]|uniref:DUF4286 family protein n=1 Tax=unclassified Paraburkholderia TaxID=2615204 RepID=UPI002AB0A5BF|nr:MULTISPECIES: DUF4286 family protein [unclassified Paraburkholderia]
MALFGCAFLALWNDVDADVEAQYERWHTHEHVPERVGIPGFLAGRRYRSDAAGQPRYFTLYEVTDAAVFDSAAYRDVIDRPTPWSAEMRPRLRNVVRATCATMASVSSVSSVGGVVQDGAALACARFSSAPDAQPAAEALLAACAALAGVRSVRLGNALDSVPQAFQQWSKNAAPTHVLLIEGDDETALRAAHSAISAAIATHGHASEAAIIDTYTLAFQIAHAEVDDALRRAQPPLTFDAHSGH